MSEGAKVEFHEIAEIFPMMTDVEMDGLVDSIRKGYDSRFPILTYENKILDGRNRYVACLKAGVEPVYSEWTGSDPLMFVVRANLRRRHLNSGQLAFVALKIEKQFAERAKKNMSAGGGDKKSGFQLIENPITEPIHAAKQAAKMVGTNHQYVIDAKKLEEEAPELADKVKSGETTLPKAKREITRKERIENIAEVVANNKPLDGIGVFPVILADPPWQYDHPISDSRRIENQYPTMPIEEICALPVDRIAAPDSILFLWVTTPFLKKGLQVLEAWGFGYRTSMVWVKPSIGPGQWVRQRHEYLLIGVRGNIPTPKGENKPDSVIEAPRTEHSKKPEIVYEIIERMYPELPKVELFARERKNTGNWCSWGNEI